MADVYCDQSLGTGSDDGTTWANAYRLLSSALNGSNVVAGDTLWVQNDQTTSGAVTFSGVTTFTNDPPRVIGVSPSTTNEPPVTADIVPGNRTGQAAAAYTHADAPIFATSVAASDITINGYFGLIYGLVLKAADDLLIGPSEFSLLSVEECEFRSSNSEAGEIKIGVSATGPGFVHFKNGKFSDGSNGEVIFVGVAGLCIIDNCEFNMPFTSFIKPGATRVIINNADFTSQSIAILDSAGGLSPQGSIQIFNSKIHASSALVTGSISEEFRAEFIQTSGVTGKTTGGSFLEVDIITNRGNIAVETTAFRTGGASDGSDGSWSLAFTPSDNGTRDNLIGLVGPWIYQKIAGDGTAQTVTVHIANSGAADYNDDDVWLEVFSPSAAGSADYDFATTQMDLEATPSVITDDTGGSSWGSGAANFQKLSKSISPDYTGIFRWRVVFAKNFASSAETLYVDPLSVIS